MAREQRGVKSIFDEAAEIVSPVDRAQYLERACGGNADLRQKVEGLLRALEQAGSFLVESPAGDARNVADRAEFRDDADRTADRSADSVEPEPSAASGRLPLQRPLAEGPGSMIGPYKLLQKIGEGGMGAVFMAEQEKPVRRKVALKVIKPGMDTGQVIARFEAERQALAIMDHPHIARVLDAGATDTGRPYFVMELVKGVPITEYCDRNHLSPRERLELFIPACQAIQHAHQKGIIHRDIKPSNVLVTLHDGKPVPKVIDFGVAKAIDQRLTERTMFTEFGAVIGTLEYMSPEQAEMGALDIDTRSDIYSLGVLLYELLTGSTPLERAKLRTAAYAEILRRIIEEEPTKPSTRLSESKGTLASISNQRKMEPARLTKLVRGELDWIVMKSLEKDRTRRYETANGFACDIQRYLDGDAVEACPPSAQYRLAKFARKHRAALATVGAFALLLVASTAVSTSLAIWANRERVRAVKAEREANDEKVRAEEQKTRAQEQKALADEQKSRAMQREQLAIDAVKRFGDVIRETPELKNDPALAPLRARLLKEPQGFFKQLRERLQTDKDTTPDSLGRLASASFQLGYLTDEIGDKHEALRDYEESLAIRERLARDYPTVTQLQSDLAWTFFKIGYQRRQMGRPEEAIAPLEQALAIRERLVRENPLVAEFQRDLAFSYGQIGVAHLDSGRSADALAFYEKFLAIMERLVRDYPTVTQFQRDLAQIHSDIAGRKLAAGRLAEALASQEQALATRERLAREKPGSNLARSDLAWSYNNMARIQGRLGRPAETLALHEKSLAIRERLARDNPSVTKYQRDLASSYDQIGAIQSKTGLRAEALASFELVLAIRERLARDNPSVTSFQRELAQTHHNIGIQRRHTGRLAEALASFEQGRAIRERLARDNPSVISYQDDLAWSHDQIGVVRVEMVLPFEALASFERAVEIREPLARKHPELPDYANELGEILNKMAMIDLDQRHFDQARAKLMQAIEWQRKALAAKPENSRYRQLLDDDLTVLIRAARGMGRTGEAAEAGRERDALRDSNPQYAALDARLTEVLGGKKAPEDALERTRLAFRAYEKSFPTSSARLYAEALANNPALAADRSTEHLFNAARAAALAASGQGKDNPPPGDAAKDKLRKQARDWLQAELTAWAKVVDSGPIVTKAKIAPTLKHWKDDPDLAGIRDEKELAKLTADERATFQQLWTDVDQLLIKAATGK